MWWMTETANEISPFNRLQRLQGEMNRLFEGTLYGREPFPAVNIWNDAEKVLFKAEIPGVDPKNLEITVLGDQLTIDGEIKAEKADEKAAWLRCERMAGKFSRSFKLPFAVDASKVEAKAKNGILRVALHRVESSKPRKIAVAAE